MIKARFTKSLPHFDLDIDIEVSNSVLVLWGDTGAGKTTVLDCIAGLALPDDGEIVINDRLVFSSAQGINLPPQQRKTGYVFQDCALFPHMSTKENLSFVLGPSRKSEADYWLDLVELGSLAHIRAGKLSGGESQRLAFARACAAKPQVLLLDEPFSSLDGKARRSMHRLFLALRAQYEMTVVFVTHSRQEAELVGQRIVALKDGQVQYSQSRESELNKRGSMSGYDLIKRIAESREACVAVSIARSTGSVPRHHGSKMLVLHNGITEGTVGGGILEAKAEQKARECLASCESAIMSFALNGTNPEEAVPVCGGNAEIWLEFIANPQLYQSALQVLDAGRPVVVCSMLRENRPVTLGIYDGQASPVVKSDHAQGSVEADKVIESLSRTSSLWAGDILYDPVFPPDTLLILGAGHVGRATALLASSLDFAVTVADPRRDYADPSRFNSAAQAPRSNRIATLVRPYVEAIKEFPLGPSTWILIVTPGHVDDLACLRAALPRDYKWLGFIGSRRKATMITDQLRSEGYDPGKIAALSGPVGIDIGAETPEEIAVAILAELIELRSAGHARRIAKSAGNKAKLSH